MKDEKPSSSDNHTLLVQLNDAVSHLGKQMSEHIDQQHLENTRLHARIDGVQIETRNGVDSIKSSLADRGRVGPSQVAVLLSALAIVGGLAQSYISVRLGNITPVIEENTRQNAEDSQTSKALSEQITLLRIEQAVLSDRAEKEEEP
jgi:hypothetical protein